MRIYILLFIGLLFVGCAQKLSEGSSVTTNTTTNVNPTLQYKPSGSSLAPIKRVPEADFSGSDETSFNGAYK